MLYSGIALGCVGGFLGIAIGTAALVGGILGRAVGGDISMSAAVLVLAVSLVALAGAVNMRRHWRAGVLLDAACGIVGYAVLPEYYIAPAIALVLPAILYLAGDVILRRRAAGQVKHAVNQARKQYAQTGELDIKRQDDGIYPIKEEINAFKRENESVTDAAGSGFAAEIFDTELDMAEPVRENLNKIKLQANNFDAELNADDKASKLSASSNAALKMPSFDKELGIGEDNAHVVQPDDNQAETTNATKQAQADNELDAAQLISNAAERAMYGCDSIVDVPGSALDQAMSAGETMAQSVPVKLQNDDSDSNTNVDEEIAPAKSPRTQPSQPISRGARNRQSKKQKGR